MAENIIEIKIGEVELRCKGDEDWPQNQLDAVLEALKRHLPDHMLRGGDNADAAGAPPSPAKLLRQSRASTFGEKAGVVAFWLQNHGGRLRWRSGEIVDVLREAGEQVPTNITDALNQKLKRGLFEVKDRMWSLTGEGTGWVKYSLLADQDGSDPQET